MPTILNTRGRADETHDGRPWPNLETVHITNNPDSETLAHYEQRINDGYAHYVDDDASIDVDTVLKGKALDARADELDIPGRSTMTADEKRDAIAAAETELTHDTAPTEDVL